MKVRTRDGQPEVVLIHIEVEAQHRGTFPKRMFDYYTLFRWRLKLPVFPIVVYLSRGAGGLVTEQYVERLFDRDINVFSFSAVGLPDLNADDYQPGSPLGAALSALMKRSRQGGDRQKLQSLSAIVSSGLDPARQALLINVVDAYLKLSTREQARFEALIAAPEAQVVKTMITVYEQRGIEKGIYRGKQEALLRLLNVKFGPVPESIRTQIEKIADNAELDRLTDRILTAQTLAEMNLPEN